MTDFLNQDIAIGDFVVSFESKEDPNGRFSKTQLVAGVVTKLSTQQVTFVNGITHEKFRRSAKNLVVMDK